MTVSGFRDILIAIGLMTAVFGLLIYYIMPMPIEYAFLSAFVVTMATVMLHEFVHMIYAEEVCRREATFTVTYFALCVTLFSIAVLIVLILIKEYTGWYSYLIPILASPGGVLVAMRDSDRCYDNVAIVAPFANLIVGIITLFHLFMVTDPPFVLNDTENLTTTLVAQVSFFSFALAFFNSIPIKVGSVATDGYWAMTVDESDKITKAVAIITMFVSFYVLFMTGWWAIKVPTTCPTCGQI